MTVIAATTMPMSTVVAVVAAAPTMVTVVNVDGGSGNGRGDGCTVAIASLSPPQLPPQAQEPYRITHRVPIVCRR